MSPPPDDDHVCGWKAYAGQLEERATELAKHALALEGRLAVLEKLAFGKKSEKTPRKAPARLPPPVQSPPVPKEEVKAHRQALSALRASHMETDVERVVVPPRDCRCGKCGSTALREVGEGKPSTTIEYVAPHFRKRVHLRQTLACACGHVITAKAPARLGEKTRYAPSFVAHLCVSKCSDSIPQYRLEKEYQRLGVPISRSTMNSLLHRAADELLPLYFRACTLVAESPVVNADETSARQQNLSKRAFMWTFSTPELSVYSYAETRSGEVARKLLGDSFGTLVVDQYTGYNQVTKPGGRKRAGCLAHARRKLFESQEHAGFPEALELIGQLYEVERQVKSAGKVGSELHLELRRQKGRPLFAELLLWGRKHRGKHEPRSAPGKAINYLMKNRRALRVFLTDPKVPIDNNEAERNLRRVALGRSNYLFFGHKDSGERHAVLYTLVTSAEKNGLNPTAYLADVLLRVQTHPADRIDELLPHKYRPPGK